jgi:hypothetical protein
MKKKVDVLDKSALYNVDPFLADLSMGERNEGCKEV